MASIFEYIIRKSYGTFSLVHGEYRNFFLEHIIFILHKWKFLLFVALLYLLNINKSNNVDKRHTIIFFSFLLYIIIFYNLTNVYPSVNFINNEVMERFTLTPIILLLSFVILTTRPIQNRHMRLTVILINVFLTVLYVIDNYKLLNFSKNDNLQRWASLRLSAIKDKKTIALVHNDNIFIVHYVQNVLGIKKIYL